MKTDLDWSLFDSSHFIYCYRQHGNLIETCKNPTQKLILHWELLSPSVEYTSQLTYFRGNHLKLMN